MGFEFGTLLSWLPAQIALSGSTIAVMGTVAVAIWYRLRAGSGDAILDRIRRLVAAKHDISHDGLRDYMTERKDREYFRFICHVSVRSISQLERVLAWIKRYEVGNDELAACRFHIEPEKPQVLVPTPLWLTFVFVFFLAVSSVGALFGLTAAVSPLFVKITATDDWFLVSADSARSTFTITHTRVQKKECNASAAPGDGYRPDQRDVAALCDLMTNPERADLLADWRRDQKWFGWGFFFFVGIFCYWLQALLSSAVEARHLFKRMRIVDAKGSSETPTEPSSQPKRPAPPQARKRRTTPRAKSESDANG